MKISFETRRKAEEERLTQIFSDYVGPRLETLRGMISETAFLFAVLQDLHDRVQKEDFVERYQNGKEQTGLKPSAALSALLQVEKRYSSNVLKLSGQLPELTKKEGQDALEQFRRRFEENWEEPAPTGWEPPSKSPTNEASQGDAEREIAEQISRTRAAHPDVVTASPQELQERLQRS